MPFKANENNKQTIMPIIFLIILTFLHAFVVGKEFNVSKPSEVLSNPNAILATAEGEPSSIVHGCVNALTGDFHDCQTDLVIAGSEPFALERYYSSSDHKKGTLCTSWNYNVGGDMLLYQGRKHNYAVAKGGGGEIVYSGPKRYSFFFLDSKILEKGITNTATGIISGQTNLKNHHAKIQDNGNLIIKTGGGIEYTYFCNSPMTEGADEYAEFFLTKTTKPNGMTITTPFVNGLFLGPLVTNKLGENLAFVKFEYPSNSQLKRHGKEHTQAIFTATTPDGRKVSYSFDIYRGRKDFKVAKNRLVLIKAERPNAPTEDYEYEYPNHDSLERISYKRRPDGRYLHVKYYNKEDVPKDQRKFCINKVKGLWGPVGTDATPLPIYLFDYKENKTIVTNGCGHTVVYDYKDNRLDAINYLDGSNIHHWESCHWGKKGSKDEGNLINRLAGNTAGILWARHYEYDHNGNVLAEDLCGNLTGVKEGLVNINWQTMTPYAHESYRQVHRYDKERNLLLESCDGAVFTLYEYHPDTRLISSKIIKDRDMVIRLREIFDYDVNNALVCHIIDDGRSSDRNNMEGVTYRKIKRFTNTQALPPPQHALLPVGLPLIEEEFFSKAGHEVLVKKLVNHYCRIGRLIRQDVFDSENTLAFSLSWEYDDFGNVLKEVNALGQETLRRYDKNGNKIFEQGPCKDIYYEYGYDFSNRMITKTEIMGNQRFTTHYRYDVMGNKIAEIDPFGQETLFVHNPFNQLIATIYPMILNEHGQPCVPEKKQGYDALGFLSYQSDLRGIGTYYANTVRGKPYRINYPDSSEEKFEYSLRGDLVKAVAKNGVYTVYEYDYLYRQISATTFDPSGQLLSATGKTYDSFNLISEMDPAGYETLYTYDHVGRLASVKKGDSFEEYAYDTLGRQIEIKTWTTVTDFIFTKKRYDLLDRLLEEFEVDQDGNKIKGTSYTYDEAGNRTSIITHNQVGIAIESFLFDGKGLEILHRDALGHETITNYKYDHINNLGQRVLQKEVCDPLGRRTLSTYDALNREVSVTEFNAFGEVIRHCDYYFDNDSRIAHECETWLTPNAPEKKAHIFRIFDSLGRIQKFSEVGEEAGQEIATRSSYDLSGRLAHRYKSDGKEIRYVYDYLGRLVEFYDLENTFHYVYFYDLNGNPIEIKDLVNDTANTRTYDAHNRVIKEIMNHGLATAYEYDRMGRITLLTYPDQSFARYSYHNSNLAKIERLNDQGEMLYEHIFQSYDASGNLLESTNPAGKLTLAYDLLNRPIRISHPERTEEITSYDAAGNLIQRNIKDSLGQVSCHYSYDERDQLTQEQGLADNRFINDSRYNHVCKNGCPQKYNFLNQLESDAHAQYLYDDRGNLIKKIGSEVIEYAYDTLDRLIKATSPVSTTTYQYDSFNRRISKISSNKVENYFYYSQKELGACIQGKCHQARIIAESDIGSTVAIELDDILYFPLHDHNGNVCTLLNKDGTTCENYRYSAFGQESIYDSCDKKANTLNPWRFASKRSDPETGLIYFGERYYDPQICRWLTQDPLGTDGGPNLYAYVLNNPLTLIDPKGLTPSTMLAETRFNSSRLMLNTAWNGLCDFGVGLTKGFIDPFDTALEHTGISSAPTKSFARSAGETVGMAANFIPIGKASNLAIRGVDTFSKTMNAAKQSLKLIRVGKNEVQVTEQAVVKLAKNLKFTRTSLKNLMNPDRYVPKHILAETILTGTKIEDPKKSLGKIKILKPLFKNGKKYNLHVVYDPLEKMIVHFHYDKFKGA